MLVKMAWKNIIYKPLNSVLCICLLLFGVSIVSVLILSQHQLKHKFNRDLENIDLVVGAKGSPLQLVLSAVYHIDTPTGNINFSEAKNIMNNPMVKEAIPLAYGDSYQGYRILGTTEAYLNKYQAKFKEGKIFQASLQAVLGAKVAETTGLKLADTFVGSHGQVEGAHVHDEHVYKVVGILDHTNSVLDNLVLTNLESVWEVHEKNHVQNANLNQVEESKGLSKNKHEHEKQDDNDHDHNHNHDHEIKSVEPNVLKNKDSLDITAVLLTYKTRTSAMSMPRLINQQTNMQAVIPALEINRLFYMLGIGVTTLKWLAGGIIFTAGFSVFLVLFSRLRERHYELALMRSVGFRPRHLLGLLLLEGFILAVIGYVLGWILSRAALYFINQQTKNDFNFQFNAGWINEEISLFLITVLVGVLAAILPALKAMKTDVSATLSKQ
ncbi:ABC transporter permease [Paucihalobacter sp.]|uniref:ABC transporter permease n=1 Tax=Paucihalobacter sp. TaxID=2850405 RepID=UPI003D160FBB